MTTLTLMMVLATHVTAQVPEVRIPAAPEVPAVPARQDMVIKWNEVCLQAIREDRTSPPVAARNLAIVHTAIYDAVMALERTHLPYLVEAAPPPGATAEAAAAAAAHQALSALYPKQRAVLDLTLERCWADLPRDESREPSVLLGRFVADRILADRGQDGADRAATRYLHKKIPGAWQPTAPHYGDALLPEWGYVRPFVIRKGTQYRPPGPPLLTSSAYTDAFNEVKRLGSRNSNARTEEQTQIAYFWADNVGTATPPGHWNKIAQTIARDRGNSLAENARLFAHLNLGLADAAVLCWVIKFTFDFWRPITAIRQADQDGNPDTDRDENWTPLLETPPFPAYISGHSTFSSTAASLLALSFGTDQIRFSTTSDDLPGVTRTYPGLWAAAEEAGMSRIYGGIHWRFDNTDGLNVGRALGEYVQRNTLQPRPRQVLRPSLYFTPPPVIIDD